MEQTTVTYYLVKQDVVSVAEDFAKMLSRLEHISAFTIESLSTNHIRLIQNNGTAPIDFSISEFQKGLGDTKQGAFLFSCNSTDGAAIRLFRILGSELEYRSFHTGLNIYLPHDPDLIDVSQLTPSEKVAKIFHTKQYQPLFLHTERGTQYSIFLGDQSVHILNPGIFKYFIDFEIDEKPTPEFSYKVAGSAQEFIALYDAELVPLTFYRYYERDPKIINYSFIDIRHPDRKIFIKPSFHVYEPTRQSYVPLSSNKSALSFADKIRPGETLDISIRRIVRDELRLADDYDRAKVNSFVFFDRDKENILTPLLHVDIYLNEATLTPEVKQQTQRGWTSLNKQVN